MAIPTTYRGQEGSASLSSNVIANVQEWTFTTDFDILDTSVMQNVAHTQRTGLIKGTGSFVVLLNYADTLGQKVLFDCFFGATPNGDLADVTLRINSTTKKINGAATLTTAPITARLNEVIKTTFNFMTNDYWSLAWA